MFDTFDNSFITGLALALGSLFILILVACVVPALILERIGLSKYFVDKTIGIFGLIGFALWIYGMFYLDLYKLFI